MAVKIVFNETAAKDLAKELRRASWGVALTASASGVHLEVALVLIAGGVGWMVLQAFAFVLESLKAKE